MSYFSIVHPSQVTGYQASFSAYAGAGLQQLVLLLCLLLGTSAAVQAAEDPAAQAAKATQAVQAAREHEQRLQQERQRLEDKIRSERSSPDVFLQPKAAAPEQPGSADSTCVNVSLIAVQGVNALDMTLIDSLSKPYLNRCLTLANINQLVKDISTLYLDRGYITSRAFIQPQRLQQGTLDILVVEGTLENLKSSDGNLTPRQLRGAFPLEEGKILNLRDLEQGIEQLNRLQQNAAELDIQPGTNTGDSLVAISNRKGRSLHAGASLDNSGSEATGEILAGLSVYWDNPLNSNDSLYLTLSDAQGGGAEAKSRSYAMAYSVPSGYALFNLSANYFEYQQLVTGAGSDFITSGTTSNQTLGVDYMLYRGQHEKFLVSSNFTHKLSKNYLADVFLDSSSRALYIADAGFTYTYKLDGGLLHSSFTWFKSLDIRDAKTKLSPAEKSYQFDKYTIDIGLSKNIDLLDRQFLYVGSAQLFYSPQDLVASEGLSIGGRYTVRGIEGEGLGGNQGGYIRNELSYAIALASGARISPYWGLDMGGVNAPEYNRGTTSLAGTLLGVRYAANYLSADCTFAKAIKVPDFINADRSGIYLNVRLSI